MLRRMTHQPSSSARLERRVDITGLRLFESVGRARERTDEPLSLCRFASRYFAPVKTIRF